MRHFADQPAGGFALVVVRGRELLRDDVAFEGLDPPAQGMIGARIASWGGLPSTLATISREASAVGIDLIVTSDIFVASPQFDNKTVALEDVRVSGFRGRDAWLCRWRMAQLLEHRTLV